VAQILGQFAVSRLHRTELPTNHPPVHYFYQESTEAWPNTEGGTSLRSLLPGKYTHFSTWPTYQERVLSNKSLAISFRSANVIRPTRSMMSRIVYVYIKYSLLLLNCLSDARRPMKRHLQRRAAQALPPKGKGRTSRYNSVHSLSNPPLRVFYKRFVLGFGPIHRFGPIRRGGVTPTSGVALATIVGLPIPKENEEILIIKAAPASRSVAATKRTQ
jgi:hypothetical protein